ncbi:PREDICTED: squalene monooxygenase-like [Priapulus caudatus]|uniref:Squalene monooxygenase n=1 Tax=Priapulus caudatus TaxID=37621 RepID=A0ABM1EZ42_PRICU|nr:PREDICTED: squalene monooxygenase-like [Priapulus caudatus]
MIFSAGLLLVTCGIVFITVLLVKVFNYKQQAKCKVNTLQDDSSPAAVVEPEVLIVGAGVVGSALAAVLGREGRNVVLLERDMSEPDRILGELLQPGGFHALQELGLEAALDGIEAEAMHGYVVHDLHTGSNVVLHYPKDAEGRVQAGRAFHHGRFIAGLRREAQKQETVTVIEATATRLIEEHGVIVGVQYKAKDGEGTQHLRASLTVVADGCFSRLRRSLVNESVVVSSHFVGVLMESCPQFQ